MEMDLEQTRYPDFKALHLYCYRVASIVGLLAAEIFATRSPHPQVRPRPRLAFQLTNIIRDVAKTRAAAASTCRWTRWRASA